MTKLITKREFAGKYHIDLALIEKSHIKWKDLQLIYDDYLNDLASLERTATYIFNTLMKITSIQSIRYRIKDPEHLIAKIIRKRILDPSRIITLSNYKNEITDLIGIRVIHLFKEQWFGIHEQIMENWDVCEMPTVYFRSGDLIQNRNTTFEFNYKEHENGYRSIHYIIETKPSKFTYFAEIQVRTIFEEAWSEIDHTVRYPNHSNNPLYSQFLMILNRLVGSADEMGSFILSLQNHISVIEQQKSDLILEKDKVISDLQNKIGKLKLKNSDLSYLTEALEKLKIHRMNQAFFESPLLKDNKLPAFPLGSMPIFDEKIIKSMQEASKGITLQFMALQSAGKKSQEDEK